MELHRLGCGPREAAVLAETDDAVRAERGLEHLGGRVGGAVVHRDDAEPRMGLTRQRDESLPQPGGAVANDQDDQDAGRLAPLAHS